MEANEVSLEGYRKVYKVRLAQGPKKRSTEVSFPYEVVEREARKRGMTIRDFLGKFQAIAQFNNFNGVIYTFEEKPSEEPSDKVKKPE